MSKGCSKPDSSSIAVLLLNICSGLGCPDISHGREKGGNYVKAVHQKIKTELKAFLQPFLPDQPPITLALATNTSRPSPPCIVSWQSVFSKCFVFLFFFFSQCLLVFLTHVFHELLQFLQIDSEDCSQQPIQVQSFNRYQTLPLQHSISYYINYYYFTYS